MIMRYINLRFTYLLPATIPCGLCVTYKYVPPLPLPLFFCLNVQSCKLFATVFSSIKTPTACQVYRLDNTTSPFTISATCVSVIQQPSGLSDSSLWNLISMVTAAVTDICKCHCI